MTDSLKAQLTKIYPELAPFAPIPAKHLPYSNLDIAQSYARFCEELSGKSFKDPCGNNISILEENFPKLLNLKLRSSGAKAKATFVLAALRSGSFDASLYTFEQDRLETIFWIPDVICDCHSLHPNCHTKIEGEEVYVKVYDKEGDPIKILFTIKNNAGQRVITTSFLTSFRRLQKFVRMPALWTKK
jgi:hypothetical protein